MHLFAADHAPRRVAREAAPARPMASRLGNRAGRRLAARLRAGGGPGLSGVAHPELLALAGRTGSPVLGDGGRPAAAAALEGDGWHADAEPDEELEGDGRAAGPPARRLQRLKIVQVTPDSQLSSGSCGQREVKWNFVLDTPAAEAGYIVQHVVGTQDIVACPGPRTGTMTKTLDFWEAWPIAKGAIVHPRTTQLGRTDTSSRGPSPNTVGTQASAGTVRFFARTTTGDLGDWNVAPADPASAWGPGKVPTSGRLPSTATKPAWWDGTPVEGPEVREARSEWDCCDADPTKHTSRVTAYPPRPARCEVKDWF